VSDYKLLEEGIYSMEFSLAISVLLGILLEAIIKKFVMY